MGFKSYAFAAVVTTVLALLLHALPAAATSHSAGSALIEVRAAGGETLPENLTEKIKAIPGVSRVEKYLLVPGQPVRDQRNEIIGLEPGAPIRIFTEDGRLIEGRIEFGRAFRDRDAGKNVALVNRVSYGMPGMVHYLGVGQSFTLEEGPFPIRIVGEVSAPAERKIFVPLDTAQKIYGKEGEVTHFFVTVKDADQAGSVERALAGSLGAAVRTTPR